MTHEIDQTFESLEEWLAWAKENPTVFDKDLRDATGRRILANGLVEPITGRVARPQDIEDLNGNWREGLAFDGISSRVRAVMRAMETVVDTKDVWNLRIYAAEGLTAFALRMRGRFPKYLGSEYTDDPVKLANLYPIEFQDLEALTLRSDTFDVVSTNEVLEHVPSIDASLRELCRVLKPGGWHIGTVPFAFMNEKSVIRSRLVDGKVEHIMEPEYHGNPMSDQGSLVFEIPGWEIVRRCREAGFSKAGMRFIASERHGCLAQHVSGVFVLCAQK
ncbi:MAG: class I SAM-dependent methyltransferase [Mesorhizobium sp.]|nr:class I SAM-dependent methyltransferase [Mesorhizobium sp.]